LRHLKLVRPSACSSCDTHLLCTSLCGVVFFDRFFFRGLSGGLPTFPTLPSPAPFPGPRGSDWMKGDAPFPPLPLRPWVCFSLTEIPSGLQRYPPDRSLEPGYLVARRGLFSPPHRPASTFSLLGFSFCDNAVSRGLFPLPSSFCKCVFVQNGTSGPGFLSIFFGTGLVVAPACPLPVWIVGSSSCFLRTSPEHGRGSRPSWYVCIF